MSQDTYTGLALGIDGPVQGREYTGRLITQSETIAVIEYDDETIVVDASTLQHTPGKPHSVAGVATTHDNTLIHLFHKSWSLKERITELEEMAKSLKRRRRGVDMEIIETMQESGQRSVKFEDNGVLRTVSMRNERYGSVEDRESFDAWLRDQGIDPVSMMQVSSSRVRSLIREYADEHNGELPPGTKSHEETKVVFRKG